MNRKKILCLDLGGYFSKYFEQQNIEPKNCLGIIVFSKPGGKSKKNSDFEKIDFDRIEFKKNGIKVGYLPDGRTVNSRGRSSDGRPTNEIIHADDSRTKIRYNS